MAADSDNPLDDLIASAGFRTKKAFAEAAGLEYYEVSRIGLGPKQRRPTGPQLRKLAVALKKNPSELAAILLPEGHLEHEVATEAIRERDRLVSELGQVRGELLEMRTQLAEAQRQVTSLGRELSELQAKKERLADDLAQERARAAGLDDRQRELRQQKAKLEQENRRLQRLVDETQNAANAIRDEAGRELYRVYGQLNELQNELGRERAAGLQRQILAGSFGAIVGAIVRGAASSGGKT